MKKYFYFGALTSVLLITLIILPCGTQGQMNVIMPAPAAQPETPVQAPGQVTQPSDQTVMPPTEQQQVPGAIEPNPQMPVVQYETTQPASNPSRIINTPKTGQEEIDEEAEELTAEPVIPVAPANPNPIVVSPEVK